MNSIGINIHNIIKGAVLDPPEWLADLVHDNLGRFVMEDNVPADPDFRVQVGDAGTTDLVNITPGPQHRLGCVIDEGRRGIFLLHHDSPDVGIFPRGTPTVQFLRGRQAASRTYGLILLAIELALRKVDGTLFHGVCLSRGETSLVLYGAHGSGKTFIALTLMRQGWDYLADDKFILHNGAAHIFEDTIGIRDHHILNIPWLAEQIGMKNATWRAAFRDMIARAGKPFIPKRYATPWQQRWDDRHATSVHAVFPEIETLETSQPDVALHLRPSDHLTLKASQDHEFHAAAAIQHMEFHEMYPMEDLFVTFCNGDFHDPRPILEKNLAGVDTYQINFTDQSKIDVIVREIEQCIEQA